MREYLLIGRRHAALSGNAMSIARWSAGVVVARWVFKDVSIDHNGHGLFASLNADARTGLACLAQVPVVFPLILLVVALYLNNGAFYVGMRETLLGADNQLGLNLERGALVSRLMRSFPLGWRCWHIFGWCLVASLAGAATVAITGTLLSTSWNGWLVWSLIAVAGWCAAKLQGILTERPYRSIIPERNLQEGRRRAREWRELRPGDNSAMPWIYAYSGLSTAEIEEEFSELGSSGPVGFTSRLMGFVVVVLFYSLLPAPDVRHFQNEGATGCLFATVHGFAGVAEENLKLSIVAAAVLLVLMPLSVLIAYLRFMVRYHFPPEAIAHVVAREARFALFMAVSSIPMITIVGSGLALLMWGSAVVADTWDSAVVGTVVLVVPVTVFSWAVRRSKVRGPLPR